MEHHPQSCHSSASKKRRPDYLFWGSFVGVLFLYCASFFPELLIYAWLHTMAHTTRETVSAIWWGVLIGAFFIGILSKIPREYILSILGPGGTMTGLLRATGAGVLLDLCSHGILMIGAKLYERGASPGQVIAFLLASPWNSFSLTLILIGLIGLQWTLIFIALSMLIAIISGFIFDLLVRYGVLPNNPNEITLPDDFRFWQQAKTQLKSTTFNFTLFKEITVTGIRDSKMVVRWLLFGILLAGAIRASMDAAQFEHMFGPTFFGLTLTVLIATVIEVCSEGSTPIAADILTRAKAPGNSFAFLMAGVSTDYTEIMILKDTTKSWKVALFLPLITLPQIILISWFVNLYG